MTTIPQFWFYSALLIGVLLVLFVMECVRACRAEATDFDRGRRWFNASILFIIGIATLYGTYVLEMHRTHLQSLITLYPGARYAPERESLSGSEQWVYVTKDPTDAIVDFYQHDSVRPPYALIVDKGTTTSRLLFSREEGKLFLTIAREGDIYIMYYSAEGDSVSVTR